MFLFDKTMPNGAAARYHKAIRFEVQADGTHAIVNSYHSEQMDIISWQDTYVIPLAVKIETLADVEYLLTYANAPFDGGVIVPDETSTLDSQKARRIAEVKLKRDAVEWAGCDTALGRVDSDPDSQRKVGGAVQMAMIAQAAGAPFSIDWTMQDNATVTHDAAAMIAMGIAVGQHVAACHEAALVKRAAIEAATTVEDVAAIDIETGWPA